jgi:RNAse (barnase) inhibitor barstar
MLKLIINLEGVHDYEEMYRRIYRGILMPDWYGANPNALWDTLSGYGYEPTHVTLIGFHQMTGTAKGLANHVLWAFDLAVERIKGFSYEIVS